LRSYVRAARCAGWIFFWNAPPPDVSNPVVQPVVAMNKRGYPNLHSTCSQGFITVSRRLKEIRHEKSVVCRRPGFDRLVAHPSDYGAHTLATDVSLGLGNCRHAGNERKVSLGVTEASLNQRPASSLDRPTRRALWLLQCNRERSEVGQAA
jgi:hypothetical protein